MTETGRSGRRGAAATNWALVTGASKGIGAAVAQQLAADGRDVIVHYGGDRDGAEATAEAVRSHGRQAEVVGADLAADLGPLLSAMDEAGGVQVLVNNAGVTVDNIALRLTDDDFARTWEVNVAAAFSLCRAALRPMLRARYGRMVNLSSVVGLHGNPGQTNYAASKAALVGMTKSLAREVARKGITVNAVAPGFVATAMTVDVATDEAVERIPAGRLGSPEEVAAAVGFLCGEAASYVNGTVLQVDGGLYA